jgi:predicted transcriptional regulator
VEILAEILVAVKTGARKTRIMYQANLSFRLLKKYLDYALEAELIAKPSENNSVYFATARGHEFLEKYDKYSLRNRQLEDMLKTLAKEKAMLNDYMAKIAGSGLKNSFLKQDKR